MAENLCNAHLYKFQVNDTVDRCLQQRIGPVQGGKARGVRSAIARQPAVVGAPAGSLGKKGYHVVKFKKKPYRNARIVWALATGCDPGDMQIDHIDIYTHQHNLR